MDEFLLERARNVPDRHFICWRCGKKAGGYHAPYGTFLPKDECALCGEWAGGGEKTKWKFD